MNKDEPYPRPATGSAVAAAEAIPLSPLLPSASLASKLEKREWRGYGAQPHSLTFGLLTLVYVLYAAFNKTKTAVTTSSQEQEQSINDLKRGLKYTAVFFLTYCGTQLRDGHFLRPHPAVWRVITGVFILYEMLLIIILFQSDGQAPLFMKNLDLSLGTPLDDKSYGEDCRVYTPDDPSSAFRNVRDTLLDRFVPMHFIGWMIGALMIRDSKICWALSILFEFYELSFAHWLPNFKECWWDHLFLDILICNAGGIALGNRICTYFEMKSYDWVGLATIPHLRGKAQRVFAQFTPMDWMPYDWAMFQSQTRFWRVIFMLFALSVMMLNSFFLKTVLWVPPSHSFNVARLIIWYSMGSYAVAEYYIFCDSTASPESQKIGSRVWLALAVVVTEVAVIVKFADGNFTAPFPPTVLIAWSIVGLLLILGSTFYFECLATQHQKNKTLATDTTKDKLM